jgi:hypothetical protein
MSGKKNKDGAAEVAPNTYTFDDGKISAVIVIRKSLTLDGIKRGRLQALAETMPEETEEQMEIKTLARWMYPQCVSCVDSGTINVNGIVYEAREIPLETFLRLPEFLTFGWMQKVEEINPELKLVLTKVDEKKI